MLSYTTLLLEYANTSTNAQGPNTEKYAVDMPAVLVLADCQNEHQLLALAFNTRPADAITCDANEPFTLHKPEMFDGFSTGH